MSLLAWLPMTKDLTQQGLSDITVSNNGATLDNNGKLGKCYHFDGNAHYLQFSKSVGDLYSGDFSYAVWLKPTDDTRSIICSEYAASGASGIAFELSASRGIRLYWNGSPDIYPTNCTLPKNEWSHVTITRSGNEAKFYINGELRYTYTGTLSNKTSTANIRLGDDYRGGTSVSYQGYMNDFRLYNHCLSAKEVEILSRGLVAHYPLNNTSGQPNLFDFESIASKWTASGTTMTNYTDPTYGNVLKVSTGSSISGETRIYRSLSNVWTASQAYTVSFMAKASKTTTVKVSRSLGDYASDFTVGTEWKRYSGTINCTVTASGGTLSIQNYTASSDLYIAQVKLELGNKVTAYQPGVGDSHYIAMGYNSTTEYDVSGYGNNMTKTGTITYVSDSARYSVSSHFINGSYLMANQNSPEYLPKDSLTVNLWVKPSTWSNPISCTEGGGWNFEGSPVQFPCYISGVGYKVAASNVTGASLQDGKWHMLTGTYDSIAQEVKIYVDGVLKTTTATGSSNNIGYVSNRLIISGEAGGGTSVASSSYVGEESDVRIYATALSAEQVADLYNTAASIDKNGVLLGYEFAEV